MWLTGRLIPDHKTIAEFRKDSGPAIKQVCVQFIELCRLMGLLTTASVAIDGSKFKAVNTRDKSCAIKHRCTTGKERRITRWEHEHVLEAVQKRLDKNPQAMRQRRETAEHPFGTLKMRMGATHFLMKRLPKVATEMALHVLAYNLTRVMNIMGIQPLMAAIRT